MSTIQEAGEGKKRIVIIGAGFAGVHTYMELHRQMHGRKDVYITLINKNDYFLFVPMIHEVAMGNLLPGSITQSLRVLPQCCLNDFIEGEVQSVDFDNQTIKYKQSHKVDNDDENFDAMEVVYDYLVLAPGARTNYFGVDGAKENTLILQDLNDAKKIKNHMLHRFEEAQTTDDENIKKEILTFVIIGGGATGVELCGEMADIFNKELKDVYPELYPLSSVKLIHAGDMLISPAVPWFAQRTQKILEAKGKVEIMLNSRVIKIEKGIVWIGDKNVCGGTIVWAGGTLASDLQTIASKKFKRNEKDNRVVTNRFLQLPEYPNVFPLGDYAWVPEKDKPDTAYPTRAQFATREGFFAGRNIKRLIDGNLNLEEFVWKDQGFIVSLGRGGALASAFGLKLSGFIAWWFYRTAYLLKIFGTRAKIRTAMEWTLNLFLPRDLSEL